MGVLLRYFFQAEELMRKIEKEEEQLAYEDPDKKIYHLCIVNLVIGYVATSGAQKLGHYEQGCLSYCLCFWS